MNDTTKYRGVDITEDRFGVVYGGGVSTTPTRTFSAMVNSQRVKGSLDEVKKKIDDWLGPENTGDEAT